MDVQRDSRFLNQNLQQDIIIIQDLLLIWRVYNLQLRKTVHILYFIILFRHTYMHTYIKTNHSLSHTLSFYFFFPTGYLCSLPQVQVPLSQLLPPPQYGILLHTCLLTEHFQTWTSISEPFQLPCLEASRVRIYSQEAQRAHPALLLTISMTLSEQVT